jgi:agmatinase
VSWEPFGGSEVPPCDLERAAFVLLPVPYDKTTTYRKGTAEGPRAILKASSQVELFDEECHLDPTERGVFTAEPLTTDAMPDVLAEQLETEVRRLLDRGKIVGCLGGEHSISLGPIRAAARAHPGLGLLQIDAHPDLRDEYEGTRFGHGCVMRRALETQEVACLVGVGWRSVSEEDHIAMGEQRIHGHFAHDLWRRSPREWIEEVLAPLPERVYVTLDVDGLDPSIVPGTGTPEPGGLAWWDTMALLKAVCARRTVVAFDVVEVLPEPPSCVSEFAAARIVLKMLAYLAAGSGR